MPIPPELLTMGFGALTGFLFKFMAERAKQKEPLVIERDILHKKIKGYYQGL